MNSKRDFFMDVFFNLIWLAVFYGLFAVPAVLWLEVRAGELLLVSIVVMFIFFFARRFIRHVVFVILAHLIVPVAAFFIAPGLFAQVQYIGVAVILAAFSLHDRYYRPDTFKAGFTLPAPLILVAFALALGYQGHDNMYPVYAVLIAFVGVGSRLHIRMTYVNESLALITQTSTQPVKKILAFDHKAMVVLSLVIVGLTVFLHMFLFRPALEAVSGLQFNFQIDLPDNYIPEPVMPQLPRGGGMDFFEQIDFDPEDWEPWLIWRVLEWLIVFVLLPALALGAGIVIYRVVREICRRLGIKNKQDHEHASGFEDIKEFIRTPKPKRTWFFGPRGEHKLRRLFRETMTKHIKKGVPIRKSDTPLEMVEKVQAEDISSLVEEYAAVRYGKL